MKFMKIMRKHDQASAEYALALDFAGKGEFDKAQVAFERALFLRPDHFDAQYDLARLLAQGEHWEKAVMAFRRVLELNPRFDQGYAELGHALIMLGRFKEAIRAINTSLNGAPEDLTAITNLAVALKEVGEAQRAKELFERVIQHAPTVAEAYQGLTEILVDREGDFAKAEAVLLAADSAVVETEKLGLIQQSMGHVKIMQGKVNDGIEWFQKAARTDPTSVDAKIAWATCLSEAHRYTEATEVLSSALQQQPKHAVAHASLGGVLEKLGRYHEAVSAFQSALSLDPKCLETEGPDWATAFDRALKACEEGR